jgi:SpoVK/Ycf46/Vps4 family AAA+-type ATPase
VSAISVSSCWLASAPTQLVTGRTLKLRSGWFLLDLFVIVSTSKAENAKLCSHKLLFAVTGADIRSVCTEAGMYAIRARRKTVTEKDFLDAVNKVIKGYQKFSATPKYMVYN